MQTREVYAPLANRLGLAVLEWKLEDYAFRYLEPDDYRCTAGVEEFMDSLEHPAPGDRGTHSCAYGGLQRNWKYGQNSAS